jgi:tight adherence protein B
MTPVLLIALSAALGVVLALYAAYSYFSTSHDDRQHLRRRLAEGPEQVVEPARESAKTDRTSGVSSIASLNTLLARFSLTAYLEKLFTQAGMKLQVGNVLSLAGAFASVTALIIQIIFHTSLFVGLACGVVAGVVLPFLLVRRRRKKRFEAFTAQLPNTLVMIQSSIHAGHSLNYALEVATEEVPEPMASELRTVLEEMRLGLSPKEALENLYRRVPINELRFFTLAVVLTREVGGNLSEVLGTLAATLRERMKLRQTIRALSAQGRASAVLLFALPPGVALAANVVSPGFIEPLYATHAGRICAAVALGFQLMGAALVKKIVNPKELSFG